MHYFRPFFAMIWIAVCAIAMLQQSRMLLHLPISWSWLEVFVFAGTIFGYHFAHPDKIFSALAWSMAIPAAIGFWLAPLPCWVMLAPSMGWLAYYGFEKTGKTGLRSRIWAKPITVALTWAWVTVVFPSYGVAAIPEYGWMFAARAFFIFALALAYDLSDTAYDKAHGFGTLAMAFGHTGTLRVIYLSLFISCILAIVQSYTFAHTLAIITARFLGALWLRTLLSKPSWHAWHKPLIDGVMVFECGSVWVFKCLSV